MGKAVFLDRDGTIIRDEGYLADPEGVRPLPGAAEALKELRKAGFALVIVTNQSGVGRGMFPMDAVRKVNERLTAIFSARGVEFDDVLVCPHAPKDDCDCRKPSPKLLLDAAEELGLDLSLSAMIGDKPSDPETGIAAGCRFNILITQTPAEFAEAPFATARDISEAASIILACNTRSST